MCVCQVLAAVTNDGKVHVFDLAENKHEPMCDQKVVRKSKLTHVRFNQRQPLLLIGDDRGSVRTCACIYVYMYIYICVLIYILCYVYIHMYIYIYILCWICVNVCMYICVYIHVYTNNLCRLCVHLSISVSMLSLCVPCVYAASTRLSVSVSVPTSVCLCLCLFLAFTRNHPRMCLCLFLAFTRNHP